MSSELNLFRWSEMAKPAVEDALSEETDAISIIWKSKFDLFVPPTSHILTPHPTDMNRIKDNNKQQ